MPAARYWRVYVTATNAGRHVGFAEVAFLDGAGVDLSVAGTAIASSEYNASFAASKAFDKDPSVSSRWSTPLGYIPGWIGYVHPSPVTPAAVSLVCDNAPENGNGVLPPSDAYVLIEYSTDGAAWTRIAWERVSGEWVNAATVRLEINHAPPSTRTVGRLTVAAASSVASAHVASTAGLQMARDAEFGGHGRIWGTTATKATPSNLPTKARVVLLHQRSKQLVRETWSDPVTGAFAFEGIDTRQEFLTLAEDAAGAYRPVAANRLVPEVPA